MTEKSAGTLFLHVGPPRTGSTAMQHVISVNRRVLEKHGIWVLAPGHEFNQSSLAEAFGAQRDAPSPLAGRSLAARLGAVRRRLTDSNVLISGESFSELTATELSWFADALGATSVKALAIGRPLERLVESYWRRRVVHGLTLSYYDYVKSLVASSDELRKVRLSKIVGELHEAFGFDGIEVSGVPAVDRNCESLVWTLSRWLGVPDSLLRLTRLDAGVRNESMDDGDLVTQVILNHIVNHEAISRIDIPKAFAVQMIQSRQRVHEYVFSDFDAAHELCRALAEREVRSLRKMALKTLEPKEQFIQGMAVD